MSILFYVLSYLYQSSASAIDLPRLCIKNASYNFDVYTSNCYSYDFIKDFTDKKVLIAIKSEHLVNGFGYKCSNSQKTLQTRIINRFDFTF